MSETRSSIVKLAGACVDSVPMESRWVDADGSYEGEVVGHRETADARRATYGSEEMVETGSGSGRTTTKPYACVDCRYATDRKNNLRRHRATMHERCERALECCGLAFASKSELRDHVAARHGAGAGYACADCGRRFGRRALMRRHAAVHALAAGGAGRPLPGGGQRRRPAAGVAAPAGRRYECRECDYATAHKSNLDRHLRRHAGPPTISADSRPAPRSCPPPPSTTSNVDHIQPTAFTTVGLQRDLGVPARNGCRCNVCLAAFYYRHQLPPSMPLSAQAPPLMFGLLPPRLADVARNFFCKSFLAAGVDAWSAGGRGGPATRDRGGPAGAARSTSSKDADGLDVAEGLGDRTSTSSAGDDAAADGDVTRDDDVTAADVISASSGTCRRPPAGRRLRLLPLLHTCRACSLTFVSQLQLKFHSDLFHRAGAGDVDARPICCRANRPLLPL